MIVADYYHYYGRHVIVADYMTSLAKTFSDLQLTACISYAIVQVRLRRRRRRRRRRRLRAGLKLRLRLKP